MGDDKEKTVIDTIKLIEDLVEQLRQCSRLVDDAEMRRVLAEAEVFLTSAPHSEAREEDKETTAEIRQLVGKLDDGHWPSMVLEQIEGEIKSIVARALSRLAAQKDEGQDAREKEYQRLVDGGPCGLMERPDIEPNGCRVVFDAEKCKGCEFYPAAPEPRPAEEPVPAPSEEAMPEAIAAADMINDAIDRARVSGDGAGLYTRILSIVDEALRSQLARKDEALRETLEAYANEANWSEDTEGVRRVWCEPGSTTPEFYAGWSLAFAALRDLDGRKGE